MSHRAEVLNLLADALDYPRPDLPARAAALADLLRTEDPDAAGAVADFERQIARQPLAQLEELYTKTFDMNPGCPLYVGYHLYGDTYKRGEMMSELQGAYRRHDLATAVELPDHLCQILRWLARAGDDPAHLPLLREHVLPAVQKVAQNFGRDSGLYSLVIGAAARAVAQSAPTGGPQP
jgi:nitrate reductase delta subunit